ncbi:hypothetical protein ACFZAD_35180 [Streptomyces iakyrus]|uniref:hypothetical protein n=1 Tax=Streptomyces iakyrus TaxID=68219 RepID=UPI0036E04106
MTHLRTHPLPGPSQPAPRQPTPPAESSGSIPQRQPGAAGRRQTTSRQHAAIASLTAQLRCAKGPVHRAARTAAHLTGRTTTPQTPRLGRLIVIAGLLSGLAACTTPSAGDPVAAHDRPAASTTPSASPRPTALATLNGPRHLRLTITSALRDAGGFVTVRGTLTNTGAKTTIVPAHLSGNEPDIVKHGPSLGGATLVDFTGGKRYYILRDTEGRPLATTALSVLKARESAPVFMQFPAPPPRARHLSLQLPQFDTATLTLTPTR